jgi:micrococcal nuclease
METSAAVFLKGRLSSIDDQGRIDNALPYHTATPIKAHFTLCPLHACCLMRKILFTIIIIANYLYIPWANALNDRQTDRQNRQRPPVWQGVVTFVSDGDSVMVRPASGGAPVKIRIDGVDAPEICQTYGPASRQALQSRVMGRTVKVEGHRRDNYGRVLARISANEGAGGDVGEWMVRQGHAWSYRFRRDAGPYAREEEQARAAKRGLFAQMSPVPPAQPLQPIQPRDFRKQHGPCDMPQSSKQRH